MVVKIVKVGMLETNCYIVSEGDASIVIDPGDDAEKILKGLEGLKLQAILLTHLHFDHIGAVRELKKLTGAKVFCSKLDLEILDESLLHKEDVSFFENESSLFEIGNLTFEIINVPGHTPGSICLYNTEQGVLFSGDTIFAGSIGVTHFKGGDFDKIKSSIKNKLFTLPDNTHVYPGHGRDFALGEEREEIARCLL